MSQPEVLDENGFFSREEYVEAHALIMPHGEAEQFVEETFFRPLPPIATGRHGYLGDGTLDLLCLVSESCAERVRQLRSETPEQARDRTQAFIQRTGLSPQWS